MNSALQTMLSKYKCQSERDYINALKEIFQEIALLGLWRSKFFENAAFYGGTALRILFGLDRFSEDMDFSLLKPDETFSLEKYNRAIVLELGAFGFEVSVETKYKSRTTAIESAFIKANTMKQLLTIQVANNIDLNLNPMHLIKIKMEVDTQPPKGFSTEAKQLLLPIPFSVLTYSPPDLLAGKIHALLCRKWQHRIKGRDWYDYYWYVSRSIPVHLNHLKERLVQTAHWDNNIPLTHEALVVLIKNRINDIHFEDAKRDVIDFLKDKTALALWSPEFFIELTGRLKSV